MISKISLFFLLCLSFAVIAQNRENQNNLTGSLSTDANLILVNYPSKGDPQISFPSENKKLPMLAGLLSLIIPGAGEIYTEEYLKAGIFLVIEVAAITVDVIYLKKGDKATEEFKTFANANWSARRYAEWLNTYRVELGITNPPIDLGLVDQKDYSQINSNESQVSVNGKAFSHHLPRYGDQQYYELIGKYHQFNHGWSDSDNNTIEWLNNISPMFVDYAKMHIKPDNIYRVASTAVIGIYVNHFLSALDAIWSATTFNKNLAVKVRLDNIQFADHAEFYPKIYLSYNF